MILRQDVKEILSIEKNKIHLCHLADVSYATMHRWLREDYEKLQLPRIIKAICEVTNISEENLFETVLHESPSNN